MNSLDNVHFFLDDSGHALEKDQWIRDYLINADQYDQKGWIICLGGGFVPLQIAVFSWELGEAYGLVEEWCCENDRAGEVNMAEEDAEDWGEYESHVIEVPHPKAILEDWEDKPNGE